MEGAEGREWLEATGSRTLVSRWEGEGASVSSWCRPGGQAGSRVGLCAAGSPGGSPGMGVRDMGRPWGTCRRLSITSIVSETEREDMAEQSGTGRKDVTKNCDLLWNPGVGGREAESM